MFVGVKATATTDDGQQTTDVLAMEHFVLFFERHVHVRSLLSARVPGFGTGTEIAMIDGTGGRRLPPACDKGRRTHGG